MTNAPSSPGSGSNAPSGNTDAAPASDSGLKANIIKLFVIALICAFTYFLPAIMPETLPLTAVQQITLVIFVGAALLWILDEMSQATISNTEDKEKLTGRNGRL